MPDDYPPQPESAPLPPPYPDKASGMAIAALVLGILSFCCCSFFAGIPAIIVGFLEKGKIDKGLSSPKGKWMAFVGIGMGLLSLLIGCVQIIWVFFFGGMQMLQNMGH